MAVPAHDLRDFEFAKKYDLEIKQSIAPYIISKTQAPKSDKDIKYKESVTAIIKHWNKEEYLLLWWNNWLYGLVGWCIEDWETSQEALKREIIEETWYTDIEIKENNLW